MSEWDFIAALRANLIASPALTIAPGDDCAELSVRSSSVLFASDMLMDGAHFDLRTTPPEQVGRKALAVNLSDIAAMAGRPTACVVSLALPRTGGGAIARAVSAGIAALAGDFGVDIAGGDTNSWQGPLVINIAILGEPSPCGSVRRSGAQVGDHIYVTGRLGGSIHARHLSFIPRVKAAQVLHERYRLHAMIDLSDGLASDLRHILTESKVGATIDRAALPIHPDCLRGSKPPWLAALSDGEDFELCFTLAPEKSAQLQRDWPRTETDDHPLLTRIGSVTAESGLLFTDGSPVPSAGFEHQFL